MEQEEILAKVDHTLLAQDATWEEIRQICDDAMHYGTASVCIPPSYVKRAHEYMGERMAVCTVIGFPNGYSTTAVKEAETKDALANGASEIDMVINLGWVKDGRDRRDLPFDGRGEDPPVRGRDARGRGLHQDVDRVCGRGRDVP